MCGIVSILTSSSSAPLADLAQAMVQRLHHRGPDAHGVWSEGPVALGHARLSIVDLSPAGAQPMTSSEGRWVLSFNGEIYNHAELRATLPGPWRGRSDTEVLLAAITAWGVDEALRRAVGMFALAAWDRQAQELWIARDRMGEKPLYYGQVAGQVRVASELKGLLAGAARPELSRPALALFLRHNYVPAPWTIWQNIWKLEPGHRLVLRAGEVPEPTQSRPYWSLSEREGEPFAGSEAEAVERLDHLLRTAVRGQMVADVPLGAFLSGGIDSSTVVALMQAQSSRPVRTFTIGFHERAYDESPHAEAVARHLGTDHTTMHVTGADALAVVPDLPRIWDEPFADSSQIPTLLLSRLTRKHVTVSLSGDGADELLAGYPRYLYADRLLRSQAWPMLVRRAARRVLTAIPPRGYALLGRVMPFMRQVGDKLHRVADVLEAQGPDDLYRRLNRYWQDPAALVVDGYEPAQHLGTMSPTWPAIRRFQSCDLRTYLPDDILVKVDRAAMAVSLETRAPFLDHRVVEFAWSLPQSMLVKKGVGKQVLRQVLARYVPPRLFDRPKMGFGIPVHEWLRGPLRPWAEDLLSEERLRRDGLLHPEAIRKSWEEHQSGRRSWGYRLWGVLMFQAWWQEQQSLITADT
ncbi:MAG: asparagine synthase (glutamine-hydrolyzing) [Planctomycetes bacterium]|nr:asparagine synthase (glutamine-hydrolyzing) [Planctomycetota bacterium]